LREVGRGGEGKEKILQKVVSCPSAKQPESGRLAQLNDIKERDYLMSPHEHLSVSDKDISSSN
jgi:hypothetical protein